MSKKFLQLTWIFMLIFVLGGMKGGVFVSSCHPRGASIGTVHPFRHKKRRQFQGAALSAKEAKLRQLLLQGLQSGHRLGVVGGVTDVFLGETSEIFKQGKGAEARSTVCDVEKKHTCRIFVFFLFPRSASQVCARKRGTKRPNNFHEITGESHCSA